MTLPYPQLIITASNTTPGVDMRIVTLSPSVTETLTLLGLEDEIVGVSPWCRVYLSKAWGKEVVGTYLDIDFRRLKRLEPDIIFLQSRVHDRWYPILREGGLNAYLIPLPTNIYAILSHIVIDVGSVTSRYYEARELAERLLDRIRRVYSLTGARTRVKVYVEYLWSDKSVSTAGALTFIDDGIRVAGGQNIFYDKPFEFFRPDDNEIVRRDPNLVLVSLEPSMRNMSVEEYRSIRGTLTNIRAFQEGRVLLVVESRNVNLAHFGPSFIDTVEWLAENLARLTP